MQTYFLRHALETVLSDESFKVVSSKVAIEARDVAVSLLRWRSADSNKEQFYTFANEIVTVLRKPIVAFSCKFCNREVLWRINSYNILQSTL